MITKEQEIKLFSAIIKMEGEMTQAISQGYKPYIGDMFQSYRNQLERLRAILFNTEFLNFCNMNKFNPLDDGHAYDEYLNCVELAQSEIDYNNLNSEYENE